jgi:hypothetical protein
MPFDGSCLLSREVRVLEAMLEFYAKEERWIKGDIFDQFEGACLYGAMFFAQNEMGLRGTDNTVAYLTRAISQHHYRAGPFTFNDRLCSGIEELRYTIRFARALAANFPADRLPPPPQKLRLKPFGYRDARQLELQFA